MTRGRLAALAVGMAGLLAALVLFGWEVRPNRFPVGAHDLLGALPLTLIAMAYFGDHWARRRRGPELAKAVLVAAAFLFWAANQYWPRSPRATLCNDIAIGLFVLDAFLAIAQRHPANGAVES